MDRTYALESPGVVTAPARIKLASGLVLLLFIVALAFLSIYRLTPPAAMPAGAPAAQFSSARAMSHVQVVASSPRPIGSAEHEAAHNYILQQLAAQGVETQVQTATAVGQAQAQTFRTGTVQNILGRLRGTANSKAVMLMAHYDSVQTSPGASDNGAGVAAMLETVRALKASAPLQNDVILLFTDGEEVGLLGARAFVEEHPWARDVGVVLNLEARGTGGPSLMFETSEGNGWLVQEFARSAEHPMGNSLSYEIYKRLPNDTDLTIFKKAGFSALNFAYIDGLTRYHSATDSIQQLDERSLQQQGANALSVVRRFGNLNLNETRGGNAVYFNLLGTTFFYYPAWLVLPLTGLTLLLFIGVLILGFWRKLLTLRGLGFGFLALLLNGLATAILISVSLRLVRALLRGDEFTPWGDIYGSKLYLAGFVCLTVAVTVALYNLFRRKTSIHNLALGAMLWWMMLTILVSLFIPGASYLLTWPLLITLVGHAIIFAGNDSSSITKFVLLAFCAIPAMLLFSPMLYLIFVAMTVNASVMLMLLLVLLLGLLISHLDLMTKASNWLVPAGAAVLGLGLLVGGLFAGGFDRSHPKTDNIFYGLNADTGQAVWASMDDRADEWTAQFFSNGGEQRALAEFFPLSDFTYLQSASPAAALAAPEVTLLDDDKNNDARILRLRITSPRNAQTVSVYPGADSPIMRASINGKPIKLDDVAAGEKWGFHYYGLPREGVELTLELKSPAPLTLRVNDRSYGLPELPGVAIKERPDYIMPSASPFSNVTLVSKAFTF